MNSQYNIEPIISFTNTTSQPRAMMIKSFYAVIAIPAMLSILVNV